MPASVERYIREGQHSTYYWPSVDQVSIECWSSVNQVLLKTLIEYQSSVNWVSIEMSIKMSLKGQSRLLIDIQPQMPLSTHDPNCHQLSSFQRSRYNLRSPVKDSFSHIIVMELISLLDVISNEEQKWGKFSLFFVSDFSKDHLIEIGGHFDM